MKLLQSPAFLICCILFILHQVFIMVFDVRLPQIDSYLDNLLAMPIILTLLLFERIYLFKWKNYKRLNLLEIVAATTFIAVVSELLFPLLSDDFTSDWLDVFFFFLGALIFYFTVNKSFSK